MTGVLLIQRPRWITQHEIFARPAGYAQHQSASARPVARTGAPGEIAEILDVGGRKPMTCPGCGKEQERPRINHWWMRLLRLMRIRPYRCRACGHRFEESAQLTLWSSAFLRPADDRRFEDLVRDIARDEREQAQPQQDKQEKTVRRLEDWPAVGIEHPRK
jgi:hypothetical protein